MHVRKFADSVAGVAALLLAGTSASAALGEPVLVQGEAVRPVPQYRDPILKQTLPDGWTDHKITGIVRYGDLNLGTPEGRAMLGHRVAWAVSQICNNRLDANTLAASDSDRECSRTAWGSAQPQIDRAVAGAWTSAAAAADKVIRVTMNR